LPWLQDVRPLLRLDFFFLIDFYVNAVREFLFKSRQRKNNGVEMREYYSITELTREFDISTRTLRFYEDEGLIQPVRRGRTRLFRPSDRHLIRQIIRGRRLGFSINEIREIIQIYREPPGEIGQLSLMIKRIEEKREDLRQRRRDLEETLAELDQAEESCVERLAELGVTT
jgi:DNA-binding transcriptional MerR regulator